MGKPTQVEKSGVAPTAMCFWCSSSQGTTSWNSKSNSSQRGKMQLIRSHQNCSYTTLTQIMLVRIKAHLGKAESIKHQCTVKAAGSSQSLCQGALHQLLQQEIGTRVYCSGTDWPLSPKHWARLCCSTSELESSRFLHLGGFAHVKFLPQILLTVSEKASNKNSRSLETKILSNIKIALVLVDRIN